MRKKIGWVVVTAVVGLGRMTAEAGSDCGCGDHHRCHHSSRAERDPNSKNERDPYDREESYNHRRWNPSQWGWARDLDPDYNYYDYPAPYDAAHDWDKGRWVRRTPSKHH